MNEAYTIYKITSPSGKGYIGLTKDLERRIKWHCRKSSHCKVLRYAIEKYGIENMKVETLEICYSLGDANFWEEFFIKEHGTYDKGYNSTKGGDGVKGIRLSKETIKRISEANRGNKNLLGYRHSEETKKKMSEFRIGKKRDELFSKMLSERNKKKVIVDGVVFDSIEETALYFGVCKRTVRLRIKNPNKAEWQFV